MFTKGSDYYSPLHYIKRFIWSILYLVFFRPSPRLAYGWRNMILRILGAKIGKSVKIFPSVKITYPWNLEIDDESIISWNVQIYNLGKITIGKATIISQNAHICAGNHNYQVPEFTLLMPPIHIGSQVWIAADAFIGPGIEIKDFAVIGARAVVVRNVELGNVVGGNPAKVLKMRDLTHFNTQYGG